MTIDWFTVGAQLLNFLVLVWLMKRFLYKPILNAIAAREKKIASELATAASKQAEAQKERDEFNRKNDEFDKQRAALLAKATAEAEAERQRLLAEARAAATALSSKLKEASRNEAVQLNQTIAHQIQHEVFRVARKMLTDLAGVSLQARMVEAFVQRLDGLSGDQKRCFLSAPQKASSPIVRSALDIPDDQRKSIEDSVKKNLGVETAVQFETAPALVSGIELTMNGQKIAWSVADYLSSVQDLIGQPAEKKANEQVA